MAAYYVKPKRRGVSGEAVLMLLGGTVALGVAGVFFMGEELKAAACVCARDLLKGVRRCCRVQVCLHPLQANRRKDWTGM